MRQVEGAAGFVFLILTGFVALYTVFEVVQFSFALRADSARIKPIDLKGFQMIQLEPLEKYQQEFSTHALFYQPKTTDPIQRVAPLDEMLKPYVLSGIVQGVEPEALIQNTLTRQTHFVQEEEQFDQFTLVKIKEHSVVVEYNGEQKELQLNYV
ncbi:MAG: hypothetical protein HY584_02495 [Candidatus Omnitrophica bacterium]|nr:hypothetical protein [Candidatus Omnitrophota bacterium]